MLSAFEISADQTSELHQRTRAICRGSRSSAPDLSVRLPLTLC
jgi:hypothetical protein